MTAATLTTMSPRRLALHRLLRHGSFWLGGGAILLILLVALVGPLFTLDPVAQNLGARLVPPVWDVRGSWAHPLGTDQLGRDLLARLVDGARISMFIGIATVLVSGLIGTAMGMAAGYFGGRVDLVINFLITIRLTLPVVLVALVVVAVVGSSLSVLVVVIGLLLWDRFAVVTRSATQRLAHSDFVIAARAIGSSTPRILLVEILPNIVGPLIVVATVEVAHAVLLEAALSFLGLGVKPPLASWGLMVAESKNQLLFRPWLIAIPGVALVTLVLAINLLGDALRDVVAPEGRA
ncbi:ABC transporter permease [Bosea sp. (in: a-proteobacteria)]|jgi:peptide/nickel transport system permease protein|uniref:ABC transporter permease n=1 Tax=Bosea sp. (in: a-proteobacteria) TaxID=1871050 RepID=UPI0008688C16|nr:ABC transporter permease [Bosea sp. (in: a-proteobacteria)]MBN9439590.1 ABC transporter permease [Bosea sp. (in: a-proteobacteria)]ODT53598.1 MAG: peptide ABC transporter permease [Methylobacterium sp. SCN 67-24]